MRPLIPVASEDAHQVVLEREEEPGAAGVALASGAAPQLVVDPPRLVALGADDVEPAEPDDLVVRGPGVAPGAFERVLPLRAGGLGPLDALAPKPDLGHLLGAAAQQDVGAPARHVGGDRDHALLPGLGHDLRLALVVLGRAVVSPASRCRIAVSRRPGRPRRRAPRAISPAVAPRAMAPPPPRRWAGSRRPRAGPVAALTAAGATGAAARPAARERGIAEPGAPRRGRRPRARRTGRRRRGRAAAPRPRSASRRSGTAARRNRRGASPSRRRRSYAGWRGRGGRSGPPGPPFPRSRRRGSRRP